MYLTGEGGRRQGGGGKEKGRDYMASCTLWKECSKENNSANKRSSIDYVIAGGCYTDLGEGSCSRHQNVLISAWK